MARIEGNYRPGMEPIPFSAVRWDVRGEARHWRGEEARDTFALTPEKFEMIDGQLFWSDDQRLTTLGALLENMGADAAVRIGDPAVWRAAVAALDS